nr:MAG TPA: ScLPMO10B, AA10, CBM33, PMO, GH61 [Caudoviricetes sp.]
MPYFLYHIHFAVFQRIGTTQCFFKCSVTYAV